MSEYGARTSWHDPDSSAIEIARLQARIAELEEALQLIRTILERPHEPAHIKLRELERTLNLSAAKGDAI